MLEKWNLIATDSSISREGEMYFKRRLEFHIRIRAARTDASQSDERFAWLLLTNNHRRNLPRIDSSSRKKGKYQELEKKLIALL